MIKNHIKINEIERKNPKNLSYIKIKKFNLKS